MPTSSDPPQIWSNVKWMYLILLFTLLTTAHFGFFYHNKLQSIVGGAGLGSTLVVLEHGADNTSAAVETATLDLETTTSSTSSTVEPKPLPDGEEYLAICMAVKNQAADLPEFLIHHYYNIGIRRFYIWDDGSEPPLTSHPNYGIPRAAITFLLDPDALSARYRQPVYYDRCVARFGDDHKWFAFIDADEFFDTPSEKTLEDVLRGFDADESIGSLGVTWITHTSNGLLSRPKSNRKAFTTCISNYDNNGKPTDNAHIKSIVKSSLYKQTASPHHFYLQGDAFTVGEDGTILTPGPFRLPMTTSLVGLHHYGVKSKQEYEEKLARSNGMGDPKSWDWWNHIEYEMPHLSCPSMSKYDP